MGSAVNKTIGGLANVPYKGDQALPLGFAGRPTVLIFGNSIAGQSCTGIIADATITTAAHDGDTAVICSGTVGNYSVGQNLGVGVKDGTFIAKISSITGTNPFTLNFTTTPLPTYIPGSNVRGVRSYSTKQPQYLRAGVGPWKQANMQLGGPAEFVDGYGFGGGLAGQMLGDLPSRLRRYRPTFVVLHLFENDIASTTSAATLNAIALAACKMCIAAGATPILCSPVPSSSYSNTKAAVFDSVRAYVLGISSSCPGAIGVNMSDLWRDTTQDAAGYRTPLSGWTDGVHPNADKYSTIANSLLVPVLSNLVSARSSMSDIAHAQIFSDMAGTGGAVDGANSATVTNNGISTGWSVQGFPSSSVAFTASKTTDSKQRLLTTATVSSTYVQAFNTFTLPTGLGGQLVHCFARVKVNAASGLTQLSLGATFNEGSFCQIGQESGWTTDSTMVGKTVVLETSVFRIPAGATTVKLQVEQFFTASSGSSDVEILEAGLVSASCPSFYDRDSF